MDTTITNVSSVSDNSGETPVVTPSNPVTTVVSAPDPVCRKCCCCYCRCCCCKCCCCCCCDDCRD